MNIIFSKILPLAVILTGLNVTLQMESINTSSNNNASRLSYSRIGIDYTNASCGNSDQLVLRAYYEQSAVRNTSAVAIIKKENGTWIGRDEDDYSGNTEVIENMTSATFRLISDMSEDNPSDSIYECPNCTLANLKLLAKMNSWKDLSNITVSVPKFQFYDLIACANFLNWRHFDEFLDKTDFLNASNFEKYFVFLPESMKKNIVGLKVRNLSAFEKLGQKIYPYLRNPSFKIKEFELVSYKTLVSALNVDVKLTFEKMKWYHINWLLPNEGEEESKYTVIRKKFFDQSVYENVKFGSENSFSGSDLFRGLNAFFRYFLDENTYDRVPIKSLNVTDVQFFLRFVQRFNNAKPICEYLIVDFDTNVEILRRLSNFASKGIMIRELNLHELLELNDLRRQKLTQFIELSAIQNIHVFSAKIDLARLSYLYARSEDILNNFGSILNVELFSSEQNLIFQEDLMNALLTKLVERFSQNYLNIKITFNKEYQESIKVWAVSGSFKNRINHVHVKFENLQNNNGEDCFKNLLESFPQIRALEFSHPLDQNVSSLMHYIFLNEDLKIYLIWNVENFPSNRLITDFFSNFHFTTNDSILIIKNSQNLSKYEKIDMSRCPILIPDFSTLL